ncbi:MAG: helicase-related protein, partial [Clostridium celatum]|nr:helicase-related protein [Clostridium celatum]
MNIDQSLGDYILGLGKKDKPLFKMIQAGSYAHSFIKLLLHKEKLTAEAFESICIVGYTDEEVCSSNLRYDQIDILEACEVTYKDVDRQTINSELIEKRQEVFSRVRANFKRFFEIDSYTLKNLIDLKMGMNTIQFSECYEDYQNTAEQFVYDDEVDTFRNIHANQIGKYIGNKDVNLLFLTGNPGIGKTTAIVNYLKKEDGYLFIYLSPRTQVNQDIEEKFTEKDGMLYDDEALYLTANGNDEKKIKGIPVNIVNFKANNEDKYKVITKPITFLPNNRERNYEEQDILFENINTTLYRQVEDQSAGVLNRLTQAINYTISKGVSNKIIATAAIQSLKSINNKKTTAEHFKKIFDTVYSEKTDTVNLEAFTCFIKRYPNVILMVDEITGDESGAAFLEELINLVFKKIYKKLPSYLKEQVNFKIVVADASITNIEVIQKHFKNSNTDSDKIYFKKQKENEEASFSVEAFKFKEKYSAIAINTNSYPAKKLHIDYKLYLNVKKVSETKDIFSKEVITNVNEQMAIEAVKVLYEKKAKQVIIYVQDIARLEDIESRITKYYKAYKKEEMIKDRDYIIINSSLSENQRKEISKVKEAAKVVLMTSSASRGISFPNTTVILVDVPRFDIEKNIMEILQLVYRGRGDERIDCNEEKYLKFYIGDTLCCEETVDSQQVQEHLVSLFTLLMLLKASILTRIYGGCNIGRQNISLVPVGGKGIGATADTLIESFSSLIRNLQKEYYQ